MKKENVIMASLIYYSVIIFLFSFAILPTPSIYIVTLGGMIIMLATEQDKLKNITYEFEDGKITSVLSSSGSGKTILCYLISNIERKYIKRIITRIKEVIDEG